MDELRHEIELLKAEIATLKEERLPQVDRASKRRDKRQVFAGFGLFAVAIVIAGTMSASALTGTNTVDTGDIKDGNVRTGDIYTNAVIGSKVKDGALRGADLADNTIGGSKLDASSMFYVAKTDVRTVTASTSGNHNVSCEPGDLALAGGFANSGTGVEIYTETPLYVESAGPHALGNSVFFQYKNTTAAPRSLYTWAVCFNETP